LLRKNKIKKLAVLEYFFLIITLFLAESYKRKALSRKYSIATLCFEL